MPDVRGRGILVFEETMVAINLTIKPHRLTRSRHIDVRHHCIREPTAADEIDVKYLETRKNHDDVLAKALATHMFRVHRNIILICA